MSTARIEILENGIRIVDLEVPRREVSDFIGSLPEPERAATVARAVELGVLALERAHTGQDLEFVRRQINSLLQDVQATVAKIPEETQKSLVAKIGTGEGQVLAPVQSLVGQVGRAADEKLAEVKQLLSQEIDPSKETSTLSKALRTLRDLLDPKRSDSVQGSLEDVMRKVSANDGMLAQAVKTVVADAVKPLAERVDALTLEFRGERAGADALAQTTEKGLTYEDEILGRLQGWSQISGAEIGHVGVDNKPGDITIAATDASDGTSKLILVVEVRDRQTPKGRKAVSDDLSAAMNERGAGSALYVSRNQDGLGKELGEWAEGACDRGPWVACTDEHLITAVRFLLVQWAIVRKRAGTRTLDAAVAVAQIERIRTALGRVKAINTKITSVRGNADEIQREVEALRDDIKSSLTDLEECLLIKPNDGPGAAVQ